MTKKEMIEKMQLVEAAAWLKFRTAHASMGQDHSITNRFRSEWCAIASVLQQVGVKADQWLPDNRAAFDIISAEHAKQEVPA
jgi:hypothetical protein